MRSSRHTGTSSSAIGTRAPSASSATLPRRRSGNRSISSSPEQLRARHWEGYRHVMQAGQSRYGEGDVLAVPGLRKDGGRVSLEFTIATIRDEAGELIGVAAILRDVTSRFDAMKALRKGAGGRG